MEKIVQKGESLPDVDLKETPESLRARLQDLVEEKQRQIDPEISNAIFPILDKMRVIGTTLYGVETYTLCFYPERPRFDTLRIADMLNRSTGRGIIPKYDYRPAPEETLQELKNKIRLLEAMR